jgi:hypothetical protein
VSHVPATVVPEARAETVRARPAARTRRLTAAITGTPYAADDAAALPDVHTHAPTHLPHVLPGTPPSSPASRS